MWNGAGRVLVYLGGPPSSDVAAKVLECGLTRRTEMNVEVVRMAGPAWRYDHGGLPCDAYALRKYMIPAYQGWQGTALYLDAASLATGDVWDLWTAPAQTSKIGQAAVWCPGETPDASVMLIDCARAEAEWGFHIDIVLKHLAENPELYDEFEALDWLARPPVRVSDRWSMSEVATPGKAGLVRYRGGPGMPPPWLCGDHPFGEPWDMELMVAVSSGYVTPELLEERAAAWGSEGGVHPYYASFAQDGSNKRRKPGKRRGRPPGAKTRKKAPEPEDTPCPS